VESKPVRRVVVGHDQQGKAVAVFDGPKTPMARSPGGNAVLNLWITAEAPVDLTGAEDRAERKVGVPPPEQGTIFRVVDFPPYSEQAQVSHAEHEKTLTGMGIDPTTQGYPRHPNTHRTKSIDYAIVLDGEIDMLMDDSEVHLKTGDVLVQQGTNHASVNNSGKSCRIAFVLIDAKSPSAWQKGWTS
jgi:mannose-6-phosphate isomerase-like protein (cupin superfamily)